MHCVKARITSLFVSIQVAGILARCKKQDKSLFKICLNFGNMQLQGEIILNLILLMECRIDLFFIRHEIAGAFVGTDEKYCRRQPVNTGM